MIPIALAETSSTGILAAVDRFIPGGIENIFGLGLGVGGILAVGTIIFAGILYVSSGDNASKQKEARAWIVAALKGLALIAGGFLILTIINPQIVNLKDVNLEKLEMVDPPIPEADLPDPINPGPPPLDQEGPIPEPLENNVRAYINKNIPTIYQGTSPWGEMNYGNCSERGTYSSSGCGPTSLTMAINYLTGRNYRVDQIGQKIVNNGQRPCGNGTSNSAITSIPKQSEFGLRSTEVSGKEEILNCLKGDGVIVSKMGGIVQPSSSCGDSTAQERARKQYSLTWSDHTTKPIFTYCGHYIVLKGIDLDNNKVWINDSNKRITSSSLDHFLRWEKNSWCVSK